MEGYAVDLRVECVGELHVVVVDETDAEPAGTVFHVVVDEVGAGSETDRRGYDGREGRHSYENRFEYLGFKSHYSCLNKSFKKRGEKSKG